jgi:hypothetical protein
LGPATVQVATNLSFQLAEYGTTAATPPFEVVVNLPYYRTGLVHPRVVVVVARWVFKFNL